jgi:hypothetical protein
MPTTKCQHAVCLSTGNPCQRYAAIYSAKYGKFFCIDHIPLDDDVALAEASAAKDARADGAPAGRRDPRKVASFNKALSSFANDSPDKPVIISFPNDFPPTTEDLITSCITFGGSTIQHVPITSVIMEGLSVSTQMELYLGKLLDSTVNLGNVGGCPPFGGKHSAVLLFPRLNMPTNLHIKSFIALEALSRFITDNDPTKIKELSNELSKVTLTTSGAPAASGSSSSAKGKQSGAGGASMGDGPKAYLPGESGAPSLGDFAIARLDLLATKIMTLLQKKWTDFSKTSSAGDAHNVLPYPHIVALFSGKIAGREADVDKLADLLDIKWERYDFPCKALQQLTKASILEDHLAELVNATAAYSVPNCNDEKHLWTILTQIATGCNVDPPAHRQIHIAPAVVEVARIACYQLGCLGTLSAIGMCNSCTFAPPPCSAPTPAAPVTVPIPPQLPSPKDANSLQQDLLASSAVAAAEAKRKYGDITQSGLVPGALLNPFGQVHPSSKAIESVGGGPLPQQSAAGGASGAMGSISQDELDRIAQAKLLRQNTMQMGSAGSFNMMGPAGSASFAFHHERLLSQANVLLASITQPDGTLDISTLPNSQQRQILNGEAGKEATLNKQPGLIILAGIGPALNGKLVQGARAKNLQAFIHIPLLRTHLINEEYSSLSPMSVCMPSASTLGPSPNSIFGPGTVSSSSSASTKTVKLTFATMSTLAHLQAALKNLKYLRQLVDNTNNVDMQFNHIDTIIALAEERNWLVVELYTVIEALFADHTFAIADWRSAGSDVSRPWLGTPGTLTTRVMTQVSNKAASRSDLDRDPSWYGMGNPAFTPAPAPAPSKLQKKVSLLLPGAVIPPPTAPAPWRSEVESLNSALKGCFNKAICAALKHGKKSCPNAEKCTLACYKTIMLAKYQPAHPDFAKLFP